MDFTSVIRTYIEKHELIRPSDRILVALSGGADSVSLLRVLMSLGYDCVAVHCNFHLRGEESLRDEAFVRDLCNTAVVELHTRSFDTLGYAEQHKVSVEMAARSLRYDAFEELRSECGAAVIAVAHHRDDSVETVMLNLIRGTGIRGLTGIKPKNGYIVRPLLCVSRESIEEYLKSIGQGFVTDSTNLQTDFTRNKIRLKLLPLMREINPSADVSVMETSIRLQHILDIYLNAVKMSLERVCIRSEELISVDIDALRKEVSVEPILFEILFPLGFSIAQISDIYYSLNSDSGRSFYADEYVAVKDRSKLLVTHNKAKGVQSIEVRVYDGLEIELGDGRKMLFQVRPAVENYLRDSQVATLDFDHTGETLCVRQVKNGDRFFPLGMKGSKLISDYMTDRKFSLLKKNSQVVVCSGKNIVWVAGERIDNRYRITGSTKRMLLISIR